MNDDFLNGFNEQGFTRGSAFLNKKLFNLEEIFRLHVPMQKNRNRRS